MRWTQVASLGAMIAIPSMTLASPETSDEQEIEWPIRLRPIKPSKLIRRGILQERSSDLSNLNFKGQSRFTYGGPTENGQRLLADVTLYAGKEMKIVNMEDFEGMTKSVDCNDDDGKMSLTFTSDEAFQYALKTWSSINTKESDKFLLVANHDGCGPDDDRQPYIVNKVTQDQKYLTTFLAAQPADWSEVAHTYDLDLGKGIQSNSSELHKRGLFDIFDIDKEKSFEIPIKVLEPNKPKKLYTDPKGIFSLSCANCYIAGALQVEGHLKVENFDPKELSIKASPRGLHGELGLEATVTASANPVDIEHNEEIFAGPIPNFGMGIGKWINIGATIRYDVQADCTLQGKAKVDFGMKVSVPDTAQATVQAFNEGDSSADGFQGDVDPYFDVKQFEAGLMFHLQSNPSVKIGFDIKKVGTLDIGLDLSLPELTANLHARYEPKGVCPDDKKHTKTGVEILVKAGVAVDIEAQAEILSKSLPGLPWRREIFSKTWDLVNRCIPIAIPGLEPPPPPINSTHSNGDNSTTNSTMHHGGNSISNSTNGTFGTDFIGNSTNSTSNSNSTTNDTSDGRIPITNRIRRANPDDGDGRIPIMNIIRGRIPITSILKRRNRKDSEARIPITNMIRRGNPGPVKLVY